jgi:hypothetical protein
MTARPRQAIAWLSYLDDPEADAAFLKLREEAEDFGSVIKVRHDPDGPGRHDTLALELSDIEIASALPPRFEQMRRLQLAINRGYCDLLQFAVFQDRPDFDYYWFIEYDVDFTGSWRTFFAEFVDTPADLLGTNLYPKALSQDWLHWKWFKPPAHVAAHSILRGFFPINRVSRRFCETYIRRVEAWEGHWEALFPSIALDAGLRVEDIGGEGPMTPRHRCQRFYTSASPHRLEEGTFRAYPRVDTHYFPNRVDALRPDHLWHPIKTDAFAISKRRARELAGASSPPPKPG